MKVILSIVMLLFMTGCLETEKKSATTGSGVPVEARGKFSPFFRYKKYGRFIWKFL